MPKKLLLSTSVLGVFALYSLHTKLEAENAPVVAIRTAAPTQSIVTPEPTVAAGSSPTPASTSLTVINPTPQGQYKDGTYTGDTADAFYGNIQVQVVISGGKITDVIFLQYPSDRNTSVYINSQAMPLLKKEAIQAQSANVSGVSGASASSGAFTQSLQSALNQAS